MKMAWAGLLLIGAASAASAQSFQTALPVSPQERRAMEARLSTILEFANTDEVNRFTLPSGRVMEVRPYRPVRAGRGGQPCRGYRIDLTNGRSRTAVDGFRCKRQGGGAWVIVEPELVLAQVGPGRQNDRGDRQARAYDEPLYPDNDRTNRQNGRRPPPNGDPARRRVERVRDVAYAARAIPVPKPAPRDERAASIAADGPAQPAQLASPSSEAAADKTLDPDTGPVASAEATRTPPALASSDSADTPVEMAANPIAETDKRTAFETRLTGVLGPSDDRFGPVAAAETARLAVPAEQDLPQPSARVVGGRTDVATETAADGAIVTALQNLDYLALNPEPTAASVERAINAFAVDEQFALPVSDEVLSERLNAAIERNETLPSCGQNALGDLCVEAAGRS